MDRLARPVQPSNAHRRPPLLASPSRRLGGAVIDGVLFVIGALVLLIVGNQWSGWPARVAFTLPFVLYQVAAIAVWGRTLGKAAMGTKVVREEDRGPVGWGAALARWAVPAVPGIALSLAGDPAGVIGLLWIIVVYSGVLRDSQRRGLHDHVAGTVVVHDPLS